MANLTSISSFQDHNISQYQCRNEEKGEIFGLLAATLCVLKNILCVSFMDIFTAWRAEPLRGYQREDNNIC